jgi:hypothetical protein
LEKEVEDKKLEFENQQQSTLHPMVYDDDEVDQQSDIN